MITVYTDYPFASLGDIPHKKAPIREMKLVGYDHDKYVKVLHEETGQHFHIKSGYIYKKPVRVEDSKGIVYLSRELETLVKDGEIKNTNIEARLYDDYL